MSEQIRGFLCELTSKIGWDGVTALGTAALAILGILTALYAKRQLEDFRKESRIKHLIDLVDQFEREPLAGYRKSLGQVRAPQGILQPLDVDDPPPALYDVINFFEHMGYLLAGNYLELDGVFVEFHYWILHVWADARELVKNEQSEDPVYYEYFERMEKHMEEYERKRKGRFVLPSTTDIEDFYAQEAHLTSGSPIPRQKRSIRRKRSGKPPSPANSGSSSV
jgi:hypothetical protein